MRDSNIVSLSTDRFNLAVQASGRYVPSFTSQYLVPEDGHVPDEEEEDIIKWCSGALYAGGADTVGAYIAATTLKAHQASRRLLS